MVTKPNLNLRIRTENKLVITKKESPTIFFCISSSSYHRKTWMVMMQEHGAGVLKKILRCQKKFIGTGKNIRIEKKNTLVSASSSSSLLSNLLANVTELSENVFEDLANDLITHTRKLLAEIKNCDEKLAVVYIKIEVETQILLEDDRDMELIEEEGGECKGHDSNYTSEDNCAVCLENFSTDESEKKMMIRMQCLHKFHEECVESWWEQTQKSCCPICRFETPLPSLVFEDIFVRGKNNHDGVRVNVENNWVYRKNQGENLNSDNLPCKN